jgi:hypothetical protein
VTTPPIPGPDAILTSTRDWLERAVIGLNLCPFARAVHINDQIRYVVSPAHDTAALLEELNHELRLLAATPEATVDTVLLIHPHVLTAFLDYNDFIGTADAAIEALGFDGVFQIASFHPLYRFAGTSEDDVTNNTNRSPYPMLQILRESSVEKAVASVPDPDDIYRRNMTTMRRLGAGGWSAMGLGRPGGRQSS